MDPPEGLPLSSQSLCSEIPVGGFGSCQKAPVRFIDSERLHLDLLPLALAALLFRCESYCKLRWIGIASRKDGAVIVDCIGCWDHRHGRPADLGRQPSIGGMLLHHVAGVLNEKAVTKLRCPSNKLLELRFTSASSDPCVPRASKSPY